MLTWFNVQKTHFSNTVHYCSSSMPRLSQTLRFLQSPSLQQAQSALIGQLTQCIVIGRTPQACVWNVTPLTIIASFSFQVRFISSSPKGEQSRDRQWWCSYVFAVHKPRLRRFLTGCTLRCATLFPSLTHTLTHTTRYAQNSAFEQSIANTWTNNKTLTVADSEVPDCHSKVGIDPFFFFKK